MWSRAKKRIENLRSINCVNSYSYITCLHASCVWKYMCISNHLECWRHGSRKRMDLGISTFSQFSSANPASTPLPQLARYTWCTSRACCDPCVSIKSRGNMKKAQWWISLLLQHFSREQTKLAANSGKKALELFRYVDIYSWWNYMHSITSLPLPKG